MSNKINGNQRNEKWRNREKKRERKKEEILKIIDKKKEAS